MRYLEGFGLTDGEGTERLWSFLRPLSVITKEMTPVHRVEVLNDALIHFCQHKTVNLGKFVSHILVSAQFAVCNFHNVIS